MTVRQNRGCAPLTARVLAWYRGGRCQDWVTGAKGKTSLLRAWADRPGQPHRIAVVQVQRDQHDAQQFWLALLDAVRHASATASATPPRS